MLAFHADERVRDAVCWRNCIVDTRYRVTEPLSPFGARMVIPCADKAPAKAPKSAACAALMAGSTQCAIIATRCRVYVFLPVGAGAEGAGRAGVTAADDLGGFCPLPADFGV